MKHLTLLIAMVAALACVVAPNAAADPVLQVSGGPFDFYPDVDTLYLEITNVGDGELSWSIANVDFFTPDPPFGSGDAVVTLVADRAGLSDFSWFASDRPFLTSNGGDVPLPINLWQSSSGLVLTLNAHPFSYDPGQITLMFSPDETSYTIGITNLGNDPLGWSMSASEPWISFSASSGSGEAVVTVTADIASLPTGRTYDADVTVTSNLGNRTYLVHAAANSPAHGGVFGLYTDAQGTDCNLSDTAPGLIQLYVVQTGIGTASGCTFAAPIPACMTNASWIGDTKPFSVTLGDSQTGVSMGYGSCLASPIHVLTINILGAGTTEPCCAYSVIPHPNVASGWIEAVDCIPATVSAYGLTSFVNSTAACSCDPLQALPVRQTTWGGVKSLYSN